MRRTPPLRPLRSSTSALLPLSLVALLASPLVPGCGGGARYRSPVGAVGADDDGGGGGAGDGGTTDDGSSESGGADLAGGGGSPDLANLVIDPNADNDHDGYTPAMGDCDDTDATVHPGAPELCDGKDHNCNGIVDDVCDDDHDGYNICPGDARCGVQTAKNGLPGGDCNDKDPLVNPGAIEIGGNHVDDNCNGQIDEAIPACDANLNPSLAASFANAMELCSPWLVSATLNADADARGRSIRTKYGTGYTPKSGVNFSMLSTGLAVDKTDKTFVEPQDGTEFTNDDTNPLPQPNTGVCGNMGADETTVHDYTELKLTLKVPTNAKAFSFDFMFDSAEYPEFVGSEFNDKFYALLASKSFTGNVSFDMKKNPITVNAGFFGVCTSEPICTFQNMTNTCTAPITQLDGTGMEDDDGSGEPIGGGTGWLTTTAPVTPGETITLRFVIFDEGDHIYDSSVIIDNFRWQAMGPMGGGGGPVTHQ